MEYGSLDYEITNEEATKLIASGRPIVDISIFDNVKDYVLSTDIKNNIEYTNELYSELYDEIYSISNKFTHMYLKQIKKYNAIDNQTLEHENAFIINLYNDYKPKNATDEMIKRGNKQLDKDFFVNTHDLLLKGTSSDTLLGLRDDNSAFVGYYENNQKIIQFLPIDVNDIDEAVNRYINIYNNRLNINHNDYDIYLKPIIYHGLISALQLFKDGNTRYARLIQHIELWRRHNLNNDKISESPILYATKQYEPFRAKYRELIVDLAVKNDQKAWDNWIIFNLKRLQDEMYKSENNIRLFKSHI